VHVALTIIGRNARNRRISGEEEKTRCVCFDDMFTVFLGAFLASDLPDVFTIFEEANSMLRDFPLSSLFRFALETLEVLVNYLVRVRVEDGRIQVEQGGGET
jgi:hypothetical protein